MVSPEESANNPGWWKDERYAIYDLNTNSAMAHPAHNERLSLGHTAAERYTLRGYAYGGGGRRVTRVEVSLDKGKSWRLSGIEYPEDRYRSAPDQDLYGGALDMWWRETSFCWCFWSLDVSVAELKDTKDIFVRAMDESLQVQPRDMYWSVLGMMNNPWFRIVIHHEGDALRFEHPTQPALMPGGWMERVKKMGGNLTNGFWGEQVQGEEVLEAVGEQAPKEVKMTRDEVTTIISLDALRSRDPKTSPWFVINGDVFDGTAFLKEHPGGAQSIISAAGLDATEEFMAIREYNLIFTQIEH
jgi:nitrate reductase (NAD(P)H)